LNAALAAFVGAYAGSKPTRKKQTISAAGRKRIAAAQRASGQIRARTGKQFADDPPSDAEMKLPAPTVSNRQVNMAAARMVECLYTDEDLKESDFNAGANIRAIHTYPLRVVITLLRQRTQEIACIGRFA
jgi:hypothetical protein